VGVFCVVAGTDSAPPPPDFFVCAVKTSVMSSCGLNLLKKSKRLGKAKNLSLDIVF